MPFEANEDGKVDTNINRGGRPRLTKPKTAREAKIRDLEKVVRKFAPHLTLAVSTAVNIMKSTSANDSNKLRAAAFITETYRNLTGQIYNWQEFEDEDEKPLADTNSAAVVFVTDFKETGT